MKSTGLPALFLQVSLLLPFAGCLPQPDVLCPTFVDEGWPLECECTAPNDVYSPTITWPGHSDNHQLVKDTIGRQDNGTIFTCQMESNGESSTTSYTLQVAYGPTSDSLDIIAPEVFVTDGTLTLNLTCQASDVNPPDLTYAWFGLGIECDGGNTGSTCSFRPQPRQQDGKTVRCRASNTAGQSIVSAMTVYSLNLTYPPTSSPFINGHTAGQVLRTGDNLTCTVVGGKPLVSDVFFSCTDPALDGAADVADESGVSSTITIDAENATGGDTVCTCWAEWELGQYNVTYSLNTTSIVHIEYNATIINFTINNSSDVLETNETSQMTATLRCDAIGQPVPVLTLIGPGHVTQNDTTETPSGYAETTFVIANITCEDMGNYSCLAYNGYQESSSVRIIVNCPPTPHRHDGDSNLPEMTDEGLTLSLVAHPVPDNISWEHTRQSTSNETREIEDVFTVDCPSSDELEYLVSCKIQARNLSTADTGLYSVSLSNGFGTYIYSFKISGDQEGIHEAERITAAGLDDIEIALIVIGSVAALVLLIVGIKVVGTVCSKEQQAYQTNPHDITTVDKTDNVAVLNHFTHAGTAANTGHPPSNAGHPVSNGIEQKQADTTYASPEDVSNHVVRAGTGNTDAQQQPAPRHDHYQSADLNGVDDAETANISNTHPGTPEQAHETVSEDDYNIPHYHQEADSEADGSDLYTYATRANTKH